MSTPNGNKIVRKVTLGIVAIAAAVLSMTAATVPASAAPATNLAPTAIAQRGSGTVSDPWVPMLQAHITCNTAGIYGNYSGGSHKSWITDLPVGTPIGVRYITSDGRSSDVLWHGGGTWGFVLASCWALN